MSRFPQTATRRTALKLTGGAIAGLATTGVAAASTGPTADFYVRPSTPITGEPTVLDARPSSDDVVDYQWTYVNPDGENDLGADFQRSAIKEFDQTGEWTIDLLVWDEHDNQDWKRTRVDVERDPSVLGTDPIGAFAATPSSPSVGDDVTLDATPSIDGNGQITDYQWTYVNPDGENDLGADFQSTVTKTFDQAGEWTIDLLVWDDDDNDYWRRKTLDVAP